MGEHKLRDANGDGEKKEPISSHIVETVWGPIGGSISKCIEEAYTRLGERAAQENSLILGVVQAISTYVMNGIGGPVSWVFVTLTAQRVSKEDFERQQRMAQFGAGPRRA